MLPAASHLLGAQTVRDIAVKQGEAYTDHIALKADSRDMDITVKIQYDQAANSLTVSVISYRSLFVFRDRARLGSLRNFFGRVMPEKFPYVLSYDPAVKYRFSPELMRSIKAPRSEHVFKGWIEYEGLQSQPSEYKMENDYIEQVFDVLSPEGVVKVTLRDIFLLEDGKILCGRDLQTRYNITLVKDPCFGREEQMELAGVTLENLVKNYETLKTTSKGGVADSRETADLFLQLQDAVRSQFPRNDAEFDCPALKSTWDAYNSLVDSLCTLKCVYTPQLAGVDPAVILKNVRIIDDNVSRYLLSSDPVERRDLVSDNEDLIGATEEIVRQNGLVDDSQKRAWAIFRKAVDYCRKTAK